MFFFVCCCHINLIAVVLEGGILLYLLKAEFLVKKFLEWPVLKFWLALFKQVNLKRRKRLLCLVHGNCVRNPRILLLEITARLILVQISNNLI